MNSIGEIPEVAGLDARGQLIRIPPELDVPLTQRVKQIIDTAEFRRLSRISQLGLVSLVYPAAHHSRFEHSLGVYRMALLYLKRLSYDERFAATDLARSHDAQRVLERRIVDEMGSARGGVPSRLDQRPSHGCRRDEIRHIVFPV